MSQATPLISNLETYLRLTESREKAISANMANIDTPGYQTKDINFDDEMKRAMSGTLSQTADGEGSRNSIPSHRKSLG